MENSRHFCLLFSNLAEMLCGSVAGQWGRAHRCPVCHQHPTGRVSARPDGGAAVQRDLGQQEPGEAWQSLQEGGWGNAAACSNPLQDLTFESSLLVS